LNEILSGKEKINLESFIIQTICLKQVFFLCQINKLPSEPLTDHFEEVLLPKLLDFLAFGRNQKIHFIYIVLANIFRPAKSCIAIE
jgi:hypothetical protein